MRFNANDQAPRIIDRATLANLTGDDKEFESDLLALYQTEAPGVVLELALAVDVLDMKSIGDKAHKLKGSSMGIGAEAVIASSMGLESAAREGRIDELDGCYRQLERDMKELLEEIQSIIGR